MKKQILTQRALPGQKTPRTGRNENRQRKRLFTAENAKGKNFGHSPDKQRRGQGFSQIDTDANNKEEDEKQKKRV